MIYDVEARSFTAKNLTLKDVNYLLSGASDILQIESYTFQEQQTEDEKLYSADVLLEGYDGQEGFFCGEEDEEVMKKADKHHSVLVKLQDHKGSDQYRLSFGQGTFKEI